MERLVSLFRRPEDFKFSEEQFPWVEQVSDEEPEYFVQLMEYLRERNGQEAANAAD